MGAGKSSVGALLAADLGCDFVDLDAVIEHKARQPIPEIFAGRGEAEFRRLESEALDWVLSAGVSRRVIALGGGAYVQAGNRERIARSTALVVFLEVTLEEAERRVRVYGKQRPLTADRDAFARLFAERDSFYRQAHFSLDTTNKSIVTIAKELAAWVREQQ